MLSNSTIGVKRSRAQMVDAKMDEMEVDSKTSSSLRQIVNKWVESTDNKLSIKVKTFADEQIDFEIYGLDSNESKSGGGGDWVDDGDFDDDEDFGDAGWGDDDEDGKSDDDGPFAFAITTNLPHSVSVNSETFENLEGDAIQFCFGDKSRSVPEILDFVTTFILKSQKEVQDAWGDAVDEEEYTIPTQSVSQSKKFSDSYQVMSRDDAMRIQRQMITRVQDQLDITSSAAATLLRYCGWDEKDLLNKYSIELAEKAGCKPYLKTVYSPPKDLEEEVCCLICYCDYPSKDTFSLTCNHRFCRACYKTHLEIALKSGTAGGSNVLHLKCPGEECKTIIGEEVFEMLLSSSRYDTFKTRMLFSFVDDNPSSTWCPQKGCEKIIAFSKKRKTVRCRCGFSFCFLCSHDAHAPCSCDEFNIWSERDKGSQSLDTKYLLDQTKACPHCGVRTKKEGGCMYIQCSQCNKPWCWQCGQSDHHVWECNRPKYGNSKGEDDPDDLNRYLFYYERFFNHNESLKYALKQERAAQKKIDKLVDEGMPYRDVEFLLKAVQLVKQCREVLRWTYAHAYFIKTDEKKREFFEFKQRKLEDYTEKISQKTEQSTEELKKNRISVLDWTNAVHQYLEAIIFSGSEMEGPRK